MTAFPKTILCSADHLFCALDSANNADEMPEGGDIFPFTAFGNVESGDGEAPGNGCFDPRQPSDIFKHTWGES